LLTKNLSETTTTYTFFLWSQARLVAWCRDSGFFCDCI